MMRAYVCGKCGEEWDSNAGDDASCPECEAVLCEHCAQWTGGLE